MSKAKSNINDFINNLVLKGLNKQEIIDALTAENYKQTDIDKVAQLMPTIPLLEYELYYSNFYKPQKSRKKVLLFGGAFLFILGLILMFFKLVPDGSGYAMYPTTVGLFMLVASTTSFVK